MSNGPEKKDSNFSLEDFKNVHNTDLVNKYGNFVNRTLKFKGLEKIKIDALEEKIKNKVEKTYNTVSDYIEKLEFRNAIQEILNLIEFGNKYYDDKMPWILYKNNIEEFNKVIYNCTYIIANLANLLEPIMPDSSKTLSRYLDIDITKWEPVEIQKEIVLDNILPLFERIK